MGDVHIRAISSELINCEDFDDLEVSALQSILTDTIGDYENLMIENKFAACKALWSLMFDDFENPEKYENLCEFVMRTLELKQEIDKRTTINEKEQKQ